MELAKLDLINNPTPNLKPKLTEHHGEYYCNTHGILWEDKSKTFSCSGCLKSKGRYEYIGRVLSACNMKHHNKYDYSNLNLTLIDMDFEYNMICPQHGEFKQTFGDHLHSYQECPECMKVELSTPDQVYDKVTDGKAILWRM